MKTSFEVAGYVLASDGRCFVIAEAGVNHNGQAELAHRLVDVAADAGADAIKFQTFSAERLVTGMSRKARYQVANTGSEGSQMEMLKGLELGGEAHRALKAHADERGIVFLSTPFDEESADELEALGVPAFKVSSGDLTNCGLLQHLAQKGRPILLSTGMGSLGEVEDAMLRLEEAGADRVALLQCTSSYPAPAGEINLRVMDTFRSAFGVPVGYSDHTIGAAVALASAARGAALLEKHFTLDRALPGPDHAASLEPRELTDLVRGIREIEAALGSSRKRPTEAERDTREVARRSLFAARPIAAGALVGADDVIALRPGTGLSPMQRGLVVGRRARRAIAPDRPIELADLD